MGTNFYWKQNADDKSLIYNGAMPEVPENEDHPEIHLGKRSGAGNFCWDCDATLKVGGLEALHKSDDGFYDSCQQCGKVVDPNYKKAENEQPTGVAYACSWTWGQNDYRVRLLCRDNPDKVWIVDEYKRDYTCQEFLKMLKTTCPMEFYDLVDQEFC